MAHKTFTIKITETLEREVEIKAANLDDAMEKAISLYNDEKVILDSSDFQDSIFDIPNIQELEQDDAYSDFLIEKAKEKFHLLNKENLSILVFGSLIDAKTAFLESRQ